MKDIHSPTTAAIRLIAFLAWSAFYIPFYALLLWSGRLGICRPFARLYWRGTAAIVGLRVVVRGTPSLQRPALFVSNHASYLDIIVLGTLLDAAFIAKKEVRQWPGFGIIARLGRTVFVDRIPRKSVQQRDEMAARLGSIGESLVLFPEGTSNDGNRVLPFKSALFSVAEIFSKTGTSLPVQPISLAYTKLDGLPIGHGWRAFYAWYGDMELAPHLWTVLGLGNVTVEVDFHAPVMLTDFTSRKALSDHCHDVIAKAVVVANAGLGGTAAAPPAPVSASPEKVIAG